MNTTDIIWTALTKTADNIERMEEPILNSNDLADAFRQLADQIEAMRAFDSADHTRLATIEERLGIEP